MKYIIFRRGTAEEAKKHNVILKANEIGREEPSGKFKVGDGVTKWNDLEYSITLPEKIYIEE